MFNFSKLFKSFFTQPKGKPVKIRDINFIKQWEGLKLKAYQDTGGVWTIGYGHTTGVKRGDVITEAQAEQFLRDDLAWVEDFLSRAVKVPLNQNQYDALCSFTFNLGETQVGGSTLLRKLNSGDYQEAARQFLRWVYDNGKVVPGLQNRRKAEMKKFLS